MGASSCNVWHHQSRDDTAGFLRFVASKWPAIGQALPYWPARHRTMASRTGQHDSQVRSMDPFAVVYKRPSRSILRDIQRDVETANLRQHWGHDTGRILLARLEPYPSEIICRFLIQTTCERFVDTDRFSSWPWMDRLDEVDSTGAPTPVVEIIKERSEAWHANDIQSRERLPRTNQVDLSDFQVFARSNSELRSVPPWRFDYDGREDEDDFTVTEELEKRIFAMSRKRMGQPRIAEELGIEMDVVCHVLRHSSIERDPAWPDSAGQWKRKPLASD